MSADLPPTPKNGPDARAPFYYEGQDLDALVEMPRYQDWVLETFRSHLFGNVMEVGAGTGNISAMYADSVDRLLLLEPAKNLQARLERRFADKPHVQVRCGFVDQLANDGSSTEANGGAFDAVVLVNVLEHVPNDAAMLSSIFTLIRPGGTLLLFVPALQWLYGELDRRIGHQRRYTPRGLGSLLREAGFHPEVMHYFDVLGVLPWFVAGRVLRHSHVSRTAAALYDRCVVPVARRVERLIRPPFGKNLISVARRPP